MTNTKWTEWTWTKWLVTQHFLLLQEKFKLERVFLNIKFSSWNKRLSSAMIHIQYTCSWASYFILSLSFFDKECSLLSSNVLHVKAMLSSMTRWYTYWIKPISHFHFVLQSNRTKKNCNSVNVEKLLKKSRRRRRNWKNGN